MILEVSPIQSSLLVHKVHDPQEEMNKSPFYTNHLPLDQNFNLLSHYYDKGYLWLTAIVRLPTPKKLSSFFSSVHIHMWSHKHINCRLQALRAWISFEWRWIQKHFGLALYVYGDKSSWVFAQKLCMGPILFVRNCNPKIYELWIILPLLSTREKPTHIVFLYLSFYVSLFVLCFFFEMHSMTKTCEKRQKEKESGKCFLSLASFKDKSFKEGTRH